MLGIDPPVSACEVMGRLTLNGHISRVVLAKEKEPPEGMIWGRPIADEKGVLIGTARLDETNWTPLKGSRLYCLLVLLSPNKTGVTGKANHLLLHETSVRGIFGRIGVADSDDREARLRSASDQARRIPII